MPPGPDGERATRLAAALDAVRGRIAAACADAERDVDAVTLVAVTKTYPASDVALLAALGVTDVGESKDQEARAKLAELAEFDDDAGVAGLRWHVVGQLQSNKARSVAGYAHAVHSVDRAKIVRALGSAAADRETPLEVFVQVSLDGDPDRGGVPDADVDTLADTVAGAAGLRLRGVMAVPPMGADADGAFARLQEISARVRAAHPSADGVSAGMSGDLEAAILHGATHVRVGTALLGRREPIVG